MSEGAPPVLAGRELVRRFAGRGGLLGARGAATLAVADVSLALDKGELVGVVGRSGAGKSSLVRLLAGLEKPDSGEILYGGRPLSGMSQGERRGFRRAVQVVFQDPAASLDPRQRIGSAVAEPLLVHRIVARGQRRARVGQILDAVGLPSDRAFVARRPEELSGGERQRLAIARALACSPRVLLLDEPVASLDVSVRGQVLNLLLELRSAFSLTMLLVAHDVALVRGICTRVVVMLRGRVVEAGPTAEVLERPRHPHTTVLLEAARLRRPSPADRGRRASVVPVVAGACAYLAECPRAVAACRVAPSLESVSADQQHSVACHNAEGS